MFWLHKEGLIDHWRQEQGQQGNYFQSSAGGIVFQPTTFGIALFLWGLGRPNDISNFYNIDEAELNIEGIVVPETGIVALNPEPGT